MSVSRPRSRHLRYRSFASVFIPSSVDSGAGFLLSNGIPKLVLHSLLRFETVLIPNKDESGAGLRLIRGRPKLVLHPFFGDERTFIPNMDESGAALSLSNRRPNLDEKVQYELIKPVAGSNAESVGKRSKSDNGEGLLGA